MKKERNIDFPFFVLLVLILGYIALLFCGCAEIRGADNAVGAAGVMSWSEKKEIVRPFDLPYVFYIALCIAQLLLFFLKKKRTETAGSVIGVINAAIYSFSPVLVNFVLHGLSSAVEYIRESGSGGMLVNGTVGFSTVGRCALVLCWVIAVYEIVLCMLEKKRTEAVFTQTKETFM